MSPDLPTSFETADALLGARSSRKLRGTHTSLVRVDAYTIAIQHWHTNVVTFYRDGAIEIMNGGHDTTTTKERINTVIRARGCAVWQEKGCWYFGPKLLDGEVSGSRVIKFRDGIVIDPKGQIESEWVSKWARAHDTMVRAEDEA